MRANDGRTQSELGSGAHSHLVIVGDDASYFELTGHYHTLPDHPVLIFVAARDTPREAVHLRKEYSEATCLFRETLGVENIIEKQISVTIEETCMSELRNYGTNLHCFAL